jgi:hypothetical protein
VPASGAAELGEAAEEIERLEAERQALFDLMATPEFYTDRGQTSRAPTSGSAR